MCTNSKSSKPLKPQCFGRSMQQTLDFTSACLLTKNAIQINASFATINSTVEQSQDEQIPLMKDASQEQQSFVGSVIEHSSEQNFTDRQQENDSDYEIQANYNKIWTGLRVTAHFSQDSSENQQHNKIVKRGSTSKEKLMSKLQIQKQKMSRVNQSQHRKLHTKSITQQMQVKRWQKPTRQRQCISMNNGPLDQQIIEDLQYLDKYKKTQRWR